MSPGPPRPRVLILANRSKEPVVEALATFRPWLEERADLVAEPDIRTLTREQVMQLPQADLALVLGGDGTLLAQARLIVDLEIPILGVNFGKLGFLAEFNLDEVQRHWRQIAAGQCPRSERLMLDVRVFDDQTPLWGGNGKATGSPAFHCLALNDAVITAGPPFRVIDLQLAIDPIGPQTQATSFSGDGVIVSTPSGSTAYNLAAGGPIVSPAIDAVCITPLSPHSLSFRPIVVNASADVWLHLQKGNEGTTLVIDGQQSVHLGSGEQVLVRQHDKSIHLLQNPELNYWKLLAKKMRWAARPRAT